MQDIPALPRTPKPAAAGLPAVGKNRLRAWISAGLLLTCLPTLDAWGLALGRARLESAIGEPLRVVIDLPALSAEEAETLTVQLADPAAYQAAGLEYKSLLPDLRVALERGQDGRARLKLSGSRSVNEAYVDLLLQARWTEGQLTRSYTLLLGPATGAAPSAPEPRRLIATPLPALAPVEPAPAPETVKPPSPRSRPVAQQQPASPAPATTVAAPSAPPAPASPVPEATPVAAPTAAPPTPVPAPTPAPAPVAAPLPEPMASAWLEPAAFIAGAALLLTGLGGLLVWLRRRRADTTARTTGSVGNEAIGSTGQGLSVATAKHAAPASSMMYSPSQLEASGEIDPIAEAEVYLAYGRDQQAEEILRDALHNHPDHVGLLLKLLEIAVKRHDRSSGKAVLEQLRTLTGAQGPAWEAASALDKRLPAEGQAPSQPVPIVPTATPEPAPEPMPNPTQPPVRTPTSATEAAQSAAQAQDSLPVLEFDMAAPAPTPEPEQSPQPESEPAAVSPTPESELDFDLSQPAPAPTPAPAPVAAPATEAEPEKMLDFDIDLTVPADAPQAPGAGPVSDLGLDFHFDLGSTAEKSAPESSGLAVSEDNSASDRLTTRIELAEEFKALGDTEGARALASQVLARATGELQARARALLDSLG